MSSHPKKVRAGPEVRGLGSPDQKQQTIYELRKIGAIAARWDAKAEAWERDLADPACHLNDDQAYVRFLRQARRLIRERQPFCATHGVIDVGCGTGLVLASLISAFAWGLGVDVSRKMIRLAQAKELGPGLFLVGDSFQLPKLCPKAGAVFSRGVLLSHYGVQQGAALLDAARSVLVRGGFLLFDFLNAAARQKQAHAPENKYWFAREQMCALAGRVGFKSVKVLGRDERRVLLLLAQRE